VPAPPRRERVDRLDHEEEDRGGDREERDHGVQEFAVAEDAAVDRERQRGEVGFADDRRDDRRDQVLHERGHHDSEGGADDYGHRQVDHVSAHEEVSEFLEHGFDSGLRPWFQVRARAMITCRRP